MSRASPIQSLVLNTPTRNPGCQFSSTNKPHSGEKQRADISGNSLRGLPLPPHLPPRVVQTGCGELLITGSSDYKEQYFRGETQFTEHTHLKNRLQMYVFNLKQYFLHRGNTLINKAYIVTEPESKRTKRPSLH